MPRCCLKNRSEECCDQCGDYRTLAGCNLPRGRQEWVKYFELVDGRIQTSQIDFLKERAQRRPAGAWPRPCSPIRRHSPPTFPSRRTFAQDINYRHSRAPAFGLPIYRENTSNTTKPEDCAIEMPAATPCSYASLALLDTVLGDGRCLRHLAWDCEGAISA